MKNTLSLIPCNFVIQIINDLSQTWQFNKTSVSRWIPLPLSLMARGNQRDLAREKAAKKAKGQKKG